MDTPYKINQPKNLAEYILKNCAASAYLIFDKKRDICTCTRCGAVKKISRMNDGEFLKHNVLHYCYECKYPATCKEFYRGRKNITDYGRILYLRKRGRTTYAELDEYVINYDGYDLPEVSYWPSAQYKLNADEQVMYKNHPGYAFAAPHWTKARTVKIPAPPSSHTGYPSKYESTFLYEPSRNSVGTDLKYANMNMNRFDLNMYEPEIVISYIYNFLRYKSIELLEKSGFENIIADKIKGFGCPAINWKGKDLRKILKMNGAEIREARGISNLSMYDLTNYSATKKEFPGFNMRDTITIARKKPSWDWDGLKGAIERWVPINKVAKYIVTQNAMFFRDYKDYLNECNILGMDMKNKKTLFPADLRAAHEETSKRIRIESDKLIVENFARFTKEITQMEKPYSYGEYIIRPAESPEELHRESEILHHCVRTYAEKVAKGNTAILFIRLAEKPDEPLFTLELNKDRKIVQCRGLRNCSYPKDVAEFIKHWEQDVVRKIA